MRIIRMAFVIVLAVVLIGVALANYHMVTLRLFPANFGQFLGGDWSVTMPIFVALFLAMLFGVLIGFFWEWLRVSRQRAESSHRAHEITRLKSELAQLRKAHAAPKDEVLAILDAQSPVANHPVTPSPSLTRA